MDNSKRSRAVKNVSACEDVSLNQAQSAGFYGMSDRRFRDLLKEGKGPKYFNPPGTKIKRWAISELIAYRDEHTVRSDDEFQKREADAKRGKETRPQKCEANAKSGKETKPQRIWKPRKRQLEPRVPRVIATNDSDNESTD